MPRDWTRYLANLRTDAGRALVEQGSRIDEARRTLTSEEYLHVLDAAGVTARDARLLATIGRRLRPILDLKPGLRLPIRIRTLATLSELSSEVLAQAVKEGRIHSVMTEADARSLRGPGVAPLQSVIRPTDNWSFATLCWPRIDGWDGHGYIPGDLYANCLWYYAQDGDLVVDPMAGSGMLFRVWNERDTWIGNEPWNINIVLSDLFPRGPHVKQILTCDLLKDFPTEKADYIIMDPPYCGLVNSQYSDLPNDLANMDTNQWINAMERIVRRFRTVQGKGGRCTIIVPNNRTITTGERVLFPEIVRRIFYQAGYELYDVTYASRRSQKKQGRQMGILNNRARRDRVPLADVSEVLTFVVPDNSNSSHK